MKKMYVLVRKDLDAVYRMVQGSHALAQFLLRFPDLGKEWNNTTIVFLGERNEDSLSLTAFKLKKKGKVFAEFYEPDLKYQLTSIACFDDGEIFKNHNIITL
jgi:hypothetical protein